MKSPFISVPGACGWQCGAGSQFQGGKARLAWVESSDSLGSARPRADLSQLFNKTVTLRFCWHHRLWGSMLNKTGPIIHEHMSKNLSNRFFGIKLNIWGNLIILTYPRPCPINRKIRETHTHTTFKLESTGNSDFFFNSTNDQNVEGNLRSSLFYLCIFSFLPILPCHHAFSTVSGISRATMLGHLEPGKVSWAGLRALWPALFTLLQAK